MSIKLLETEFVLIEDGEMLKFSDGQIIIYGDKAEAEEDAKSGGIVISCTHLSKELQQELINNIIKFQ